MPVVRRVVILVAGLATASHAAAAQGLADSVRKYLVFAPAGESWFVVANHGKRMLLDIGRVDLEVRKDSAVAAAYREVVARETSVPLGTSFVLRAGWGTELVEATSVDVWQDRIVLVLSGSGALDSIAQGDPVVASAFRTRDGVATARRRASVPARPAPTAGASASRIVPTPRCDIGVPVPPARLSVIRDSLESVLRSAGPPPYERLGRRLTVATSHLSGCFGQWRVVLAVSLRSPAAEWTRQRVVLVDARGRPSTATLDDLRFSVHDLVSAFDADGDGVDDVAAVGRRHRAGGTTLLRLDPRTRRFSRVASGFAWEDY